MTTKINTDVFGYFEGSGSKPAHDPGITTYCLFCTKQLSQPIRTVSFTVPGSNRSYFYRCHKECYESKTEQEICDYESAIVDQTEEQGL